MKNFSKRKKKDNLKKKKKKKKKKRGKKNFVFSYLPMCDIRLIFLYSVNEVSLMNPYAEDDLST